MKITPSGLLNVILTTMLVTSLFLMNVKSPEPYDPWADMNDDGFIDIKDILYVALRYGALGDPINKTELLLELQSRIDAFETRIPKKGFIAVPPSAFTPTDYRVEYAKHPEYLTGNGSFVASLQLPHGVNLVNMTVYLTAVFEYNNISVYLVKSNLTSYADSYKMAEVNTSSYTSPPGDIILYDDTIAYAETDNRNWTYSITIALRKISVLHCLKGIVIEYEYPA